ncbi:hypothetical protein DM02DRAFT_233087 [Periconia macrospinosa]|uniref:Uncharacterized protein n=1 Tax=Periconia macrospinosa TaxID=97972 RepID=A0A2V1ECF5_9PLEO|nr:hypothetical protein DM02DRAFT_233087 [Periconia macrospinosa]
MYIQRPKQDQQYFRFRFSFFFLSFVGDIPSSSANDWVLFHFCLFFSLGLVLGRGSDVTHIHTHTFVDMCACMICLRNLCLVSFSYVMVMVALIYNGYNNIFPPKQASKQKIRWNDFSKT